MIVKLRKKELVVNGYLNINDDQNYTDRDYKYTFDVTGAPDDVYILLPAYVQQDRGENAADIIAFKAASDYLITPEKQPRKVGP